MHWPTLHDLLVIAVHLGLLGVGAWLVVIDARTHRLPNRIVLPLGAGLVVLIGAEALAIGDATRFGQALLGMVILAGFYALLNLAGGGVGGGDVKLSAVIGLVLAWHGWQALAVGAAAAFLLGAVYALMLMSLRRARRNTRIAFGPWMIIGAAIGIAMG
jgi:leader peptidase (prepilin peptidase)/N-methyltransferase